MDKDSEFSKSKLGLIVIAAIGLLLGAWLWLSTYSLETAINHKTAENTENYKSAPYIGVKDECAVISPAQINNCISEKAERVREGQRKEYDLQAQQIAALWSRTTGQATIIAMAVGFFGIGLVFFTFWEARRAANAGFAANRIAEESNERQLRAYIALERCTIAAFHDEGEIIMQVRLRNCGQTPAKNVRVMAESFSAPYDLLIDREFYDVESKFGSSIGPGLDISCTKRILTNDVSGAIAAAIAKTCCPHIQGICRYEDAFGNECFTKFRYVFSGIISTTGLVMEGTLTGNDAT